MAAYLLDTNPASPLVTTGHPLPRRVHERVAAGDTFALCVPVLTETLFGPCASSSGIVSVCRVTMRRPDCQDLAELGDCRRLGAPWMPLLTHPAACAVVSFVRFLAFKKT